MQYTKFLCEFCGLSTDNEYSLHHYFSDALSVQDIKFVEDITNFVEQRNNGFKKDNFHVIKNIASETIINQDATDSLISCTEYGRKTYENFPDEPLFKTLFQKRRWKQIPTNPLDIQHFIASKYIDYARLRIYKIRKLLSLVSFYNKHIGTINIGKQTNMK